MKSFHLLNILNMFFLLSLKRNKVLLHYFHHYPWLTRILVVLSHDNELVKHYYGIPCTLGVPSHSKMMSFPGVNFINVKRANFKYESAFRQLFLLTCNCQKDVRTKNARVKHWWNWTLLSFCTSKHNYILRLSEHRQPNRFNA